MAVADNNALTVPISIREEKLHVLVVESSPRWEYRYLRNALSRDPGVNLSCLLYHPGLSNGLLDGLQGTSGLFSFEFDGSVRGGMAAGTYSFTPNPGFADGLAKRGWMVDQQKPPPSLHCTVNAIHDGKIADFVADLRAAVDEVLDSTATGAQGAYGTVE